MSNKNIGVKVSNMIFFMFTLAFLCTIVAACLAPSPRKGAQNTANEWTQHEGMYSGSFDGLFDNSAGKNLHMTTNIWQDPLSAMIRVEILEHGNVRPNIRNRSFIRGWINPGYPSAQAIELYYINGVFLDKEMKLAHALASDSQSVLLYINPDNSGLRQYRVVMPSFPSDTAILSIGYGKVVSPQDWAMHQVDDMPFI